MPKDFGQLKEELKRLLEGKVDEEVIKKVLDLVDKLEGYLRKDEYGEYYEYYAEPYLQALHGVLGKLGLAEALKEIERPVGVEFEEACLLREAKSAKGLDWEVVLLREGITVSKDKYFTKQAVDDVVRLVNERQVKAYIDHPTVEEERQRPERSVRDVVGWFSDAVLHEENGVSEARAILHLLGTPIGVMISTAIRDGMERGNPKIYGISIRGVGIPDPSDRSKIVRVTALYSADIVTEPNAYGRFVRMKESRRRNLMEEIKVDTLVAKPAVETKSHERGPVILGESAKEIFDRHICRMVAYIKGDDVCVCHKYPAFRSFREAYCQITGADYYAPGLPEMMLQQAVGYNSGVELREATVTTADWAKILGSAMYRVLLDFYMSEDRLDDWKKVVSSVTKLPDFRPQRRLHLGGVAALSEVAEGANIPEVAAATPEEEVTYSPRVRALLYPITLQVMANDDVNVVQAILRRLATAAKQTVYNDIFISWLANNGTYTGDNTALFSVAHGNMGNAALSTAALSAVRNAMIQQSVRGATGLRAGIVPRFILVPPQLYDLATQLVESDVQVDGLGSGNSQFVPNPHKGMFEVIMVPDWSDANDWVVIADPKRFPTFEVGFYGKQTPELVIQSTPTEGTVFTANKITIKVQIVFGTAALDYKTMYKNVVT